LVIEVNATNFSLLSPEEQDAKIYAYASLLNSLSFPIQIVIRSKRLDISSYLALLDEEKNKIQNPALVAQIGQYRSFVQELVKVNTVLDKKFYIVISYSSLERGAAGAGQTIKNSNQGDFVLGAKSSLHSKAESIHSQLMRLNLKAETLGKEKLAKLFYNIFNDVGIEHPEAAQATKPMTLGREVK